MSRIPWDDIGRDIVELHESHHQKNGLTVKQRYDPQMEMFEKILDTVGQMDAVLIQEYIAERAPINMLLTKIQTSVKAELEELFRDVDLKVTPASSFSAGTNLIQESDIDFNVPVKNLDTETLVRLSNLCGTKGYRFTGALSTDNPGIYYVFSKIVGQGDTKVEIEVKIRHAEVYEQIHSKMHYYLDNTMSTEQKAIITWIKYNLSKSKDKSYYKAFKALYYEYALAKAGVYEMIYPLKALKGGRRTRRKTKNLFPKSTKEWRQIL